MPTTITVKNIPQELYGLLKKRAAHNHRSINNEMIALIENTFLSQRINPDDFLASAQKLREKSKGFTLTEEVIRRAKYEGRP